MRHARGALSALPTPGTRQRVRLMAVMQAWRAPP